MHASFVCYRGRFVRDCERTPAASNLHWSEPPEDSDHETTCSSGERSTTDGIDGVRGANGTITEAVGQQLESEAGGNPNHAEHSKKGHDTETTSQKAQEHEIGNRDDAGRAIVQFKGAGEIGF